MHSCHLSKGQRQFLGSKGISANEWDSMPDYKQREWLKEMENPQFETAYNLRNKNFKVAWNLMPSNHWTKKY